MRRRLVLGISLLASFSAAFACSGVGPAPLPAPEATPSTEPDAGLPAVAAVVDGAAPVDDAGDGGAPRRTGQLDIDRTGAQPRLLRDGVPFVPYGLTSLGVGSPRRCGADGDPCGIGSAYQKAVALYTAHPEGLRTLLANLGATWVRYNVGVAWLDPESPAHDPDFAGEVCAAVGRARDAGLAVTVTMMQTDGTGDAPDYYANDRGRSPGIENLRAITALAAACPDRVTDRGVLWGPVNEPSYARGGADWLAQVNPIVRGIRSLGITGLLAIQYEALSTKTPALDPAKIDDPQRDFMMTWHGYPSADRPSHTAADFDRWGVYCTTNHVPCMMEEWFTGDQSACNPLGTMPADSPHIVQNLLAYLQGGAAGGARGGAPSAENQDWGIGGFVAEWPHRFTQKGKGGDLDVYTSEPSSFVGFSDCTSGAQNHGPGAMLKAFFAAPHAAPQIL